MKFIKRRKYLLAVIIFFVILGFLLPYYSKAKVFNNFDVEFKNFLTQKNSKEQEIVPISEHLAENSIEAQATTKIEEPIKEDKNDKNFQRNRFFAIDSNGESSLNTVFKCEGNIEVEITNDKEKADFSYYINSVPSNRLANKKKPYVMVYAMESEPHSSGGETWEFADFKMWYDLDKSFPEPATYFDVKVFLADLLSPPRVEFDNKENASSISWILSNCNAFNGREKFVKKLMDRITVDSFGFCLRNKDTHTSQRMFGNTELYSKYKFVISIENSNCHDYVTEKLVHAVASGSIPIVAGKDNKPDYLRYMPKNSYINIYDFKTVDDLVKHLKTVGSDKKEYEKYIHFKRKHNYTREQLNNLSLKELISLTKTIFDSSEQFLNQIVLKEKSENKLCKLARYISSTPNEVVLSQIEKNRNNRPESSEACLNNLNLENDFKI